MEVSFQNPGLGFARYQGQAAGAGVSASAREAVVRSMEEAGRFHQKTSASDPEQKSDDSGSCSSLCGPSKGQAS